VFAPAFVRLWVGAEWYAGPALPWLAAANAVALGVASVWGWLFAGAGKVRSLLPVHLTQTAVNVVVSVLATWQVGLPGPLLGTLAGYCGVSLWWIPVLLRRHFGVPLGPLAAAIFSPLLLAVSFALAMLALTTVWAPSGWASLAACLALSAVGYLLLAWLVILDSQERALWRHRVALVFVLHRAG
jgi:O-antigen/teichoic acid export membrane protein